jgi:lysophospholipase L1-like esterase
MKTSLRRTAALVAAALFAALAPTALPAPAASATGTAAGPARLSVQEQHRPPSHRYVALGDSYSSGEGTKVYLSGTDTADDRCHRSRLAYPRLLADRQPRLRGLSFVACSGASTRDLYHRNDEYPSEPAQLAALRRRTKAVTITIGGNDVGFAAVIAACLAVGPTPDASCATSPSVDPLVRARIAALAGRPTPGVLDPQGQAITPIRKVLTDIHTRAPHAKIFVAGYPRLFGTEEKHFTATGAGAATCIVNSDIGARITYADAQWLNRRTRQLDGVLHTAARQARRAGISAHYVSASTFKGHGLCDAKKSWIRPLLFDGLLPATESFHPTRRGQRSGYLRAFERAGL